MVIIKETLLSNTLACLAKQKGFISEKAYNVKTGSITTSSNRTDYWDDEIPLCTLSYLQQWLRDVKFIHITIDYVDDLLCYGFKITDIKTNTILVEPSYKPNYFVNKGYTYNEALEVGILEYFNY